MTKLNNTKETLEKALGKVEKPVEKVVLSDHDFIIMKDIKEGEWLDCYLEEGQTFEQYNSYNKITKKRKYIYILQFDDFDEKSPSLDLIQKYIKAFYFGMEVKVLEKKVNISKVNSRINPNTKKIQLKSRDLTSILLDIIPNDAYCLIGVTMKDLYPKDSWNFVFGEAYLEKRVGIFSFARYNPDFLGEENPKRSILERSCEVCVHEIGHMFGMEHCIYYECVMNGSNSLEESDSRPIELCPICLRKLQKVIGFDYIERYKSLYEFMKENEFNDTNWLKKRLSYLQNELLEKCTL